MCIPALLVAVGACLHAQSAAIEKAWALAANGDRAGAIALTQELARQQPGNADVRLLLGSLLAEEGQQQDAIDQLREAVRIRPDSAEAWNTLGEAYKDFGRGKGARDSFEHAVELNPNYGVAQFNFGAVLLGAAEPSEAASHLDRAIQLLGNSAEAADAHYLRSKICSAAGQTEEAARHLQQAVKLRADFAEAWSDLGEARRLKLDSPGALSAFERAVQLNPADAVAQYRLGAEYLRRDQTNRALEHLEAAYKLASQDQSTLNALQSALRQAGRMADAARIKQELAAVLRTRDQRSQAKLTAIKLNNEGAALERAGNLARAVERYREALSLDPDHNGIRVNYAAALLRLGRWTEGLTELHEASETDPENRDIQVALRDALAQAPHSLLPAWATVRTKP